MLTRSVLCLSLCVSLTIGALQAGSLHAEEQIAGKNVSFKLLSGEETGLKAIMEKWAADELQRQGGKYIDHGWWPWGLLAWDYNNDGAIDFLAAHHGAPLSIIIKNQFKESGKLTFVNANAELGLPPNALGGCFKPTALDIDGDGFVDLLYSDIGSNNVFFNREGKRFEPMGLSLGQLSHVSDTGEVDESGYPIVGNNSLRYAYDPSAKKYKSQPWQDAMHGNPPECLAQYLADLKTKKENRFLHYEFIHATLSGDGTDYLVCTGFAEYSSTLFGRYLAVGKDGKYSDVTEQLGLPEHGRAILFIDLNGDGIDDVLIVGAGLYLSDGKGHFALKSGPVTDYLKAVGPYLLKAFTVDFDNNGRMDLVLNNPRGGSTAILENLGNGEFKQLCKAGSWDADPVAICDINDDGLMDVCIGGPGNTISIYINQSANPGHGCLLFPRMEKPNPYAVGARFEFYRAGELGKPGARPFQIRSANSNGLPIHAGLGEATSFDLRATFPGKTPLVHELKGVEAAKKLKITADGKIEKMP
jgi:hypothetical protein